MKLYYDDICFNNKRIIESGFINIYKNKIIVICGPNGSGKSSLVKNAILNEKNNDLGIIYVNQNNDMLIAEMSIIENITMSSEKEYNLKIEQEIKDLGFDYLLDKDIKKLSGGEKRLLTLMRGFFSKESILLIDEPTNDLDYVIVNQVIDILKKIKSKKQIVMISHDNRIKEIADTIYKIKNCKLELSQNDKEQCIPNQENIDSNIKKDIKIIEKMFKKNYISVLIVLFFIVAVCILMKDYSESVDKEVKRIREGQMNIFSIASRSNSSSNINITYFSDSLRILNMTNILEMIRVVNSKNKEEKMYLNDLSYYKCSDYTVYPIEYYDLEEKQSYFVLDCYLQNEYGVTLEEGRLDTSSYFEQPYLYSEDNAKEYKFSIDKYVEYVRMLEDKPSASGKKLKLVCAVVVLNNKGKSEDFHISELFDKITKSGAYVTYNVLSESMKDINNITLFTRSCVKILILTVFVTLLDVLYWLLYMKIQKNKIILLKNYSYKKCEIMDEVSTIINNRTPKLILFSMLIIYNFICFVDVPFCQINYYWCFFCTIPMSLMYFLGNKIIYRFIDYYYRWNV